jgi:hypothetical protein
LTDMMIFWLIIWRMATLNFSYDYNMWFYKSLTRLLSCSLLAKIQHRDWTNTDWVPVPGISYIDDSPWLTMVLLKDVVISGLLALWWCKIGTYSVEVVL